MYSARPSSVERLVQIDFDVVRGDDDVRQILALQAVNHRSAVDPLSAERDGFTTVRHDFELLREMNREHPSAIARCGDELAGYCLMMPQSFRRRIPVLEPMFDLLDGLQWQNRSLANDPRWFVMGQVCVASDYRGRGVFDGLYDQLRRAHSKAFDFTITEISRRNGRSLRAHRRVGFQTLHDYLDPVADDHWEVVLWDWR